MFILLAYNVFSVSLPENSSIEIQSRTHGASEREPPAPNTRGREPS